MSDFWASLEATFNISNISSSASSDRKTTLLHAKFLVYFQLISAADIIQAHPSNSTETSVTMLMGGLAHKAVNFDEGPTCCHD